LLATNRYMGYLLKFLILSLVIWLIFSFLRKLANPGDQNEKPATGAKFENMVQCEICGVYTPGSKVTRNNGKNICRSCSKQDKK